MFIYLTAEADGTEVFDTSGAWVNRIIERFFPGTQSSFWLIFVAFLLVAVAAYLIGSINPAIIYSKIFYHDDIRKHGSGNAGSTNMLRTYGKGMAALTFASDLGKAAVAVLLGTGFCGVSGGAVAGFFVILGHMFPIYYRFHGGKGVACLAMVCLLQSPIAFAILLGIFLIIVIGTRYVSLGSIMAAMLYPLILRAFANVGLNVAMAVLCAVFVVFMHRANIKRLWNGTESKINLGRKKKSDDK